MCHALIFFTLTKLSSSQSQSWKRRGACGWGDLEQTPRRLCLAALGRSTLLSLRVYGGPVVKYCTHQLGPIKYACFTKTWGFCGKSRKVSPLAQTYHC